MSENARKLQPLASTPDNKGQIKSHRPLNQRILVVEDEKSVASAYQSILSPNYQNVIPFRRTSRQMKGPPPAPREKIEFEVTLSFSAIEALRHVEKAVQNEKFFAMAFVDVVLGGGMDGIELVKKIYELDPEIYVVFVTAYNDRSVDSIQSLLGENKGYRWDYLNKPFSDGEILQKARNAVAWWNLQREKFIQEGALAEANRRLITNERSTSVAAVARSVSHEFGNILLQIIGRAELSRDGPAEEMRTALDSILKATETASSILDRFKRLGRPFESQQQKEMLSIQDPLDETLLLMDHQIKNFSIKICRIKNDRFQLLLNRTSMVQVFVNLILNAIHAMDQYGQIDFSIMRDESWCEVIVRDYGRGIPAEHMDQVLEPFFTTKKDKGTGLGLSICREIIEIEHHGQFLVRNHAVKGAEFVIRIPIEESENE